MAEEQKATTNNGEEEVTDLVQAGPVASWLAENQIEVESLGPDHSGVETVRIAADFLLPIATALSAYGFNYLSCQGGIDLGPGKELVSFYHLVKLTENGDRPEEVRLKVFLPRDNPQVPSVYWIWKAADWQERETYDMYGIYFEGHPNLKRLLMPEDWEGWPLRKDYISPDFYEIQHAY